MDIQKICIYDTNKIKSIFSQNKKVIAYGNGRFYERIIHFIDELNFKFDDILYTKNDTILSKSGVEFKNLDKNSFIVICSSFYEDIIDLLLLNNIKKENIVYLYINCEDTEFAKLYKQNLSATMKKKHLYYLEKIKVKSKIKIVFFALNKGIWKLDSLFKRFQTDPKFEVLIFVTPHITFGKDFMLEELEDVYNFFNEKGYPVVSSYDKINNRWIPLNEIKPDIIFFTKPHFSTIKEYYYNAFKNYLTAYAGYGVNVAKLGNNKQFNQVFHNTLWKSFSNSKFTFNSYEKYCSSGNTNVTLTGDIQCEELLFNNYKEHKYENSDHRIKIIYAPHHTIEVNKDTGYRLSTFLEYALCIKNLATKYKEQITWIFKPHPTLKPKLYSHKQWGKEKTDNYYNFWKNSDFTQLEEGEYIDLFKQSDAMIHDSASFLYEYLTQKKPVLYLTSSSTNTSLNELGKEALKACYKTESNEDIENFIINLINKNISIKKEHLEFYNKEFIDLYKTPPSEKIYNAIKSELQNGVKK